MIVVCKWFSKLRKKDPSVTCLSFPDYLTVTTDSEKSLTLVGSLNVLSLSQGVAKGHQIHTFLASSTASLSAVRVVFGQIRLNSQNNGLANSVLSTTALCPTSCGLENWRGPHFSHPGTFVFGQSCHVVLFYYSLVIAERVYPSFQVGEGTSTVPSSQHQPAFLSGFDEHGTHIFSNGSVHSFPQSAAPYLVPQFQPFAPFAPSAPTPHRYATLKGGHTHCPHLYGCSPGSPSCRPDTGFRSTGGGAFLGHRASKVRHKSCAPACPGFRHLMHARQKRRSMPSPSMPSPSPRFVPPCQDIEEAYTHQPESHWVGSQSSPSSHTQLSIHPTTPEQPTSDAVSSSPPLSPPVTHPAVPEEPAIDAAPSPQQSFALCSPPPDVPPWDDKISILFIPEPMFSISSLEGKHGDSPSYYLAHLHWTSLPSRTREILKDWVHVKGPEDEDTGLSPVLIHEYVSLASPFPIMTDTQ